MDIGSFFLTWAAVPLALSMAGYLLVAAGVRDFRMSARTIYWLLFGMVLISFVYLYHLFVTDQFQYTYVSGYSSSDLKNVWPHFYKVSALWAGQQGTFLLWLLFGVTLGFWVRYKAKDNEGWVMFFYILGQTFLLLLTLISNPFQKMAFPPPNGQGLNPLLQNYWMQIHPPIVFLGYASACIPFAFAMASLAKGKYDNWVKQTMPWAVFTVVTLGLGIFLGGYWAYETLGWGGYWAWDPVENSSLIPWMVSVALVHGMVVEKSRGTWRRTNMFLAISLFLLIIYGTFLTRSGVLANFSVHSFTDLGYNNLLWGSIIFFGLIFYGLWAYRARKMKVPSASGTAILSQEFTTFVSMILLLPFTLIVLFWTSFPLITTILGKIPLISKIAPTPAAIDTSSYNMVGIVFGIIFCIILGLNALLSWKKTDPTDVKKKIIIPAFIALAGSIVIIILGFSKIALLWSPGETGEITFKVIIMAALYFLFLFTALFSLVSNLILLIRRLKTGLKHSGGYITHVGFALLLIGVIFSSSFGSKRKLTIPLGGTGKAFGYSILYKAQKATEPKVERSYFELTKGDKTIYGFTDSKEVNRGNQIQYARTPYIYKYLFSDLYLSVENLSRPDQSDLEPFDLSAGGTFNVRGTEIVFNGFDSKKNADILAKVQPQLLELVKSQSGILAGKNVKFVNFEMSQHQGGAGTLIGAILAVDNGAQVDTVTPYFAPSGDRGYTSPPIDFPGGGKISLAGINANKGSVSLSYVSSEEMPDIELGALTTVISGNDTSIVTPSFNPSDPFSTKAQSETESGTLHLVDVNPATNSAQFMFIPESQPILATIEISTKPMINLVWIGFLLLVAGAIVAFYRRISEKQNN